MRCTTPSKADRTIVVTPSVSGWVLVAGQSLPQRLGDSFVDKSSLLLKRLGQSFPDVQYFCTHPDLDYYAWARVLDGHLVRAFATGDDGQICDVGRTTPQEKSLGLRYFELRGVDRRQGDAGGAIIFAATEAQVLQLAALWSINPQRLDANLFTTEDADCHVGRLPLVWRAQLKKIRSAA